MELLSRWDRQFKVDRVKNLVLHVDHLRARVNIVRHILEVQQLWGVHLAVFTCDPQRCHTNQLVLRSVNVSGLSEAIDQRHAQVQSIGLEVKPQVHINEPINEDDPHLRVDCCLLHKELLWAHSVLTLTGKQILQ